MKLTLSTILVGTTLAFIFLVLGGCDTQSEDKAAIAQSAAETVPTRPPNIVLILADDLGIGDTSVYGSEVIDTPNIDNLASRGVRFTQGYVSHPVCSPSRAGLLTGRYQQRHGWEFNPAGRDKNSGMSTTEDTLATALKAAGYTSGLVGKWHLGQGAAYHPLARGFDEFFGLLAGGSLFIDPTASGVESIGELPAKRGANNGIFDGRQSVIVEDYLTDVFTDKAVSFIERHQHQPFFLFLSHTTPHTPLQATEKYLHRYRHIENAATRIYAAMVASLDDSVGAIVAKLEETGNLDNTLIVFTSDNGCAGYLKGACSNAPYAGFKRYHQEGGIRVPFIASWPARVPMGSTYNQPVISLDLMATFAAVAGSSATTEDSVNLLPFITGETKTAPHDYLYWRSGPTIAIRDQRWKLIRYNHSQFSAKDVRADGRLEPPAGGWATDSPQGQLTLLYDLVNDPGETENLAAEHPNIVARLASAHAQWAATLTTEPILPGMRSIITKIDGETVQLIF